MKRMSAVVILSITNVFSTLGTFLIVVIVISASDFNNKIDTYITFEPFLIVALLIIIEIMKWLAFYFIVFRKKNSWLFFPIFYVIPLLIAGYIFMASLMLFIIFSYILAVYFLYEANKLDSLNSKILLDKETEANQNPLKENMEKFHYIAMTLLLIVSLYITYRWMNMASAIYIYPKLITYPTFIGTFIFATLMAFLSFWSLKKIRTNRGSSWKLIYIVPLATPMIRWIVDGFFVDRSFNMVIRLSNLYPIVYFLVCICYGIALILLAKKDEV